MLLWKCGCGVLVLGVLGHIVGVASPYWMQTGGVGVGLWQVCAHDQCVSFLDKLDSLSVWFHAVQALCLAGMVLSIFSLVTAAVYMKSQSLSLPLAPGMLTFSAGILVGTGVLIYAAEEWGDASDLDWAFFIEVGVVALLLIASLVFLIAAALTRRKTRVVNLSVRYSKSSIPTAEVIPTTEL